VQPHVLTTHKRLEHIQHIPEHISQLKTGGIQALKPLHRANYSKER